MTPTIQPPEPPVRLQASDIKELTPEQIKEHFKGRIMSTVAPDCRYWKKMNG